MDIQRLILRLMADASQYHKTLNNVVRDTSSAVGRMVKDFSGGVASMVKNLSMGARQIGVQWSGAFAGMSRDASKTFNKIAQMGAKNMMSGGGGGGGGMFSGLIGSIARLTIVVTALHLAFKGLDTIKEGGTRAVTLAADYQDAATSFEVFTGSADKAKEMIGQIQKLAQATPHQSAEMLASARQLMGAGVDQENILPALKQIGAITAAAGGGAEKFKQITKAYTDVVAKGVFQGQELRQFTEAGVPAKAFADILGVSVTQFHKMMQAGEIGSDVVVKAFNRMTEAGGKLDGVQEKMGLNARGIWNSISEGADLALQKLGLGILDAVKDSGAYDAINAALTDATAGAPDAGKMIGEQFANAKQIVLSFRGGLEDSWEILKKMNSAAVEFLSLFDAGDLTFSDFLTALGAIPAALSALFYSTRSGLYEYMLVPLIKIIDTVHHALSVVTPGDAVGYDPQEYKNLVEEFMGQSKLDSDKSPIHDFLKKLKDRTKGVTEGANEAAEALKKIGGVTLPEKLFPRDLQKFLEESQTEHTNTHGGKFENTFRKFEALAKANEMSQNPSLPFDPAKAPYYGEKGAKAYAFTAGKLLDELRNSVGGTEIKPPAWITKGTAEAQDIINRSSHEQLSVAQEMKMLLERANILNEERNKYEKEAAEALTELRRRGLVKGRI